MKIRIEQLYELYQKESEKKPDHSDDIKNKLDEYFQKSELSQEMQEEFNYYIFALRRVQERQGFIQGFQCAVALFIEGISEVD